MPRLRPSGPVPAKIMLVGEAPGKQEELTGAPFVGSSGQELTAMLNEAGLSRSELYLTNVFYSRPPANKIEAWCGKKAEVGGRLYPYPPLRPGKYFKLEHINDVAEQDFAFLGETTSPPMTVLDRLAEEIKRVDPNVIVALGNTAAWALLGTAKIKKMRGTICPCTLVPGYKVLPTFHPAYIMRAWDDRPVAVVDLMKAKRESLFKEIRRPHRVVHIDPTIDDLVEWRKRLCSESMLAFDIETGAQMIKCVGFAPNIREAFVIPFVDFRKPGFSYWPDERSERFAWETVRMICASPAKKLAHNGLYDVQYLWRAGCPVFNFVEDTMILNHSLQPEMEKSLGFLGSVHTDEASWKLLRPRGDDVTKRDE